MVRHSLLLAPARCQQALEKAQKSAVLAQIGGSPTLPVSIQRIIGRCCRPKNSSSSTTYAGTSNNPAPRSIAVVRVERRAPGTCDESRPPRRVDTDVAHDPFDRGGVFDIEVAPPNTVRTPSSDTRAAPSANAPSSTAERCSQSTRRDCDTDPRVRFHTRSRSGACRVRSTARECAGAASRGLRWVAPREVGTSATRSAAASRTRCRVRPRAQTSAASARYAFGFLKSMQTVGRSTTRLVTGSLTMRDPGSFDRRCPAPRRVDPSTTSGFAAGVRGRRTVRRRR